MAITITAIDETIARFTSKKCHQQVNSLAPFIGKKHIETLDKPDRVGVVNVKGSLTTYLVADGGTLPTGRNAEIGQCTYTPVAFVTRLSLPRIAINTARGAEDGINLTLEQLDAASETLARRLGRAVFQDGFGTDGAQSAHELDGIVAAAATTFTAADVSGLRAGVRYDVIDNDDDATVLDTITVVHVTGDGAGSYTVTFTPAATGAGWAADDYLVEEDQTSGSTAMVSLLDAANGTNAIYSESFASTPVDWAGNLDSTTTAFTAANAKDMLVQVMRRRAVKPSCFVMNSLNEQRLYESQSGDVRYYGNDTLDEYGHTHRFNGIPIVVDENCPDKMAALFQKKDIKLHQFRAFSPVVDGGGSGAMGRGSMLVDQSSLSWDVQIEGYYNLRVERRNGCGVYSALAS